MFVLGCDEGLGDSEVDDLGLGDSARKRVGGHGLCGWPPRLQAGDAPVVEGRGRGRHRIGALRMGQPGPWRKLGFRGLRGETPAARL